MEKERIMPNSRRLSVVVSTLIAAALLPIAAVSAEECPQVVERWPAGPADAVFTRAGRSYFGSGTVLTIGDVTTPSSPSVLGEIDLGLLIHDIVVDDHDAWVAAGNMVAGPGTVFWLDVEDPAAPEVLAAWEVPLPARSVAVGDEVVFAGLVDPLDPDRGMLLEIAPGATPASPPRITTIGTVGWPERLDLAEETLWVVELGTGARAFDVSEDGLLAEVAHLAGDIRDLEAAGELLYLADWRDDDPDVLRIVDVADPAQPVDLAEYRADRLRKVRVVGPTAYLASSPAESSIRLELVNVSDPANPTRKDVISLGSLRGDAFLHDLAVANRIVHISNSRGGPWLVEDPPTGEPRLIGSYSTPGVTEAVVVSGELLAVAGGESGLLLFDLGSAAGLVPLNLPDAVGGFAKDVAIAGTTAYVASWRDGVRVLDLSDPRAPVEIARVATDGPCFRVVVDGDHLFATLASSPNVSTAIFDVSDPAAPHQVSELQGGVLAVADGFAYSDWSDWAGRCALATWDVADPGSPATQPSRINFFADCDRCGLPWPDYPRSYELQPHHAIAGLTLAGGRGWVALGTGGLHLLEMSDPASPDVVASLDSIACGTSATAAARDAAYVATAAPSGLLRVIVSPDGELRETGFVELPGYPAAAVLAGTVIYTADLTAGVSVLDIAACHGPLRPAGRRSP
jgi:hypothetical protein